MSRNTVSAPANDPGAVRNHDKNGRSVDRLRPLLPPPSRAPRLVCTPILPRSFDRLSCLPHGSVVPRLPGPRPKAADRHTRGPCLPSDTLTRLGGLPKSDSTRGTKSATAVAPPTQATRPGTSVASKRPGRITDPDFPAGLRKQQALAAHPIGPHRAAPERKGLMPVSGGEEQPAQTQSEPATGSRRMCLNLRPSHMTRTLIQSHTSLTCGSVIPSACIQTAGDESEARFSFEKRASDLLLHRRGDRI